MRLRQPVVERHGVPRVLEGSAQETGFRFVLRSRGLVQRELRAREARMRERVAMDRASDRALEVGDGLLRVRATRPATSSRTPVPP